MTDYSKITALYSRLSVGDEDRDGGESNSIQNQKIFLENYARGQHLGVPVTLTCKCCGQEFASKRTNTLFCGPNCRAKFYRQEAAESRSRECTCENCGKVFTTTRSDVKYCSDDCRYAAQIKRQGARKKALREAKNEEEAKTA